MDLNILSPKKAVESAFEKPNIPIALGLVLVAAVVWLALAFLMSGVISAEVALLAVVSGLLKFVALAAIVFVIGMILSGKTAKGHFSGTLSAVSMLQILGIVTYVISTAAFFMLFPKGVPAGVDLNSGDMLTVAVQLYGAIAPSLESINFGLLYALWAVAAGLQLFGLYLISLAMRRLAGTGWFGSLVAAAIALAAVSLLPI